MSFNLKKNGDAIEQRCAEDIGAHFENYEKLWVEHVVPITWRRAPGQCTYVRAAVPKALKKLATYNYGVFLHLAACHEQLRFADNTSADPGQIAGSYAELFARTEIYSFYSRLFSAGELVTMFLVAVKVVVEKYGEERLDKVDARLGPELSDKYRTEFKARTRDYRNPQVHRNWGFPAIGRLIPRRKYLGKWSEKD
jgi:hypothetical protein